MERAADDVRTLDVELVPAGSLSVQVTVPVPSPTALEPATEFEVFDSTREQWRNVAMYLHNPDDAAAQCRLHA